jgi:hypothetical protein
MKREFPSTPGEAFESSNEGLYYGRQIVHGCWSSQPLHNFASHGADAFRMLAVSIGSLQSKGLSAEEWKSLRQQYVV